MIDARCECGIAYSVPEGDAEGRSLLCRKCGRELRFVAAEALPDRAGVGDFDARLVITAGPARIGEQFLLGGCSEIEIGKLPERHVALIGDKVSRLHCKLVRLDFGPSRWKLEDHHSTNGLFVNGKRVASQELHHGDVIHVGDYQLKFLADAALFPPMPAAPAPPSVAIGQPTCPSCGRAVARNAKICVTCGIYIATGRPLVTSKGFDEDDFAIRADTWIRVVSWVVPLGLFPVASEAFGTRKPYATWIITGITVVASLLYFGVLFGTDFEEIDPAFLNLMQWSGSRAALEKQRERFLARAESERNRPENLTPVEARRRLRELAREIPAEYPEGVGFRWYQPFTHVLLHGDIMHLAGNLLFLLVFGLRVNELVGNWKMAILYPLLGAMAATVDLVVHMNSPLRPSLGASGAIMGLAGMYFVFFPVQKVRMAIWLRGGILTGWRVIYKLFSMRGFWLLALWVGFNDLLPMFIGSRDNVGHWAHLGGFMSGALLAVGLMVARLVDARRGDLLSVALGRHAWALLGRPGEPPAATTPWSTPKLGPSGNSAPAASPRP